jgi:predicted secreted protein
MIRHALALCVLTLLAVGGCNDKNAPPVSPTDPAGMTSAPAAAGQANAASEAKETVVRTEDDGKAVEVARGGTVTFKLVSNSGTGYVWVPTQVDNNVLAQQGDRTSEVSSDTPGSAKLDVYRFAAHNAGSSAVEMSLKRPFGSAPPARTLHVTVNVR